MAFVLSMAEANKCAICKCGFEERDAGEGLETLLCGHSFHELCFANSLEACGKNLHNMPCPVCRLTSKDIQDKEAEFIQSQGKLSKADSKAKAKTPTKAKPEPAKAKAAKAKAAPSLQQVLSKAAPSKPKKTAGEDLLEETQVEQSLQGEATTGEAASTSIAQATTQMEAPMMKTEDLGDTLPMDVDASVGALVSVGVPTPSAEGSVSTPIAEGSVGVQTPDAIAVAPTEQPPPQPAPTEQPPPQPVDKDQEEEAEQPPPQPVDKDKEAAGTAIVGQDALVANPEPETMVSCWFCEQQVPTSAANPTAKGFKCKKCSRIDAEVSRQVGNVGWLRALTREQQIGFYNSARTLPAKDIQGLCLRTVSVQHKVEREFAESGERLPLSVWVAKGYDAKMIEEGATPDDIQTCAKYGWKTYRVPVLSDRKTKTISTVDALQIIQKSRARGLKRSASDISEPAALMDREPSRAAGASSAIADIAAEPAGPKSDKEGASSSNSSESNASVSDDSEGSSDSDRKKNRRRPRSAPLRHPPTAMVRPRRARRRRARNSRRRRAARRMRTCQSSPRKNLLRTRRKRWFST